MHFGIFTVGDVTPDPTNGRTPTEAERIQAMVAIALKAEEVGLDVFATGEHHNPPFIASAPTTTLAYIGAQTERIKLSTSTTLISSGRTCLKSRLTVVRSVGSKRVSAVEMPWRTAPAWPERPPPLTVATTSYWPRRSVTSIITRWPSGWTRSSRTPKAPRASAPVVHPSLSSA